MTAWQTANRKPQTANRKPQTANRKPQTAHRAPRTRAAAGDGLLDVRGQHYGALTAGNGLNVLAELSSAAPASPVQPGQREVGISASGGSAETVQALAAARAGGARTVALVNVSGTAIAQHADMLIELHAGPELGGVGCRPFRHTLAMPLALAPVDSLVSDKRGAALVSVVQDAARACDQLVSTAPEWLPELSRALAGGTGVWLAASVGAYGGSGAGSPDA